MSADRLLVFLCSLHCLYWLGVGFLCLLCPRVSFSRAKSAGFLPLAEWGRMHFYRPSHDTSEVWLGEQWTSKLPSVVSEVTPNLLLGWVRGHHLPGVKPSLCKFPPTLFHGSALHPRCQRHQSLQL